MAVGYFRHELYIHVVVIMIYAFIFGMPQGMVTHKPVLNLSVKYKGLDVGIYNLFSVTFSLVSHSPDCLCYGINPFTASG